MTESIADLINERLKCESGLDGFARHAGVRTLDDLLKWVEMERRSILTMTHNHELGIHEMSSDISDFVYGKSAILWEVHVNLLHVMKGMRNEMQPI